MRGRCSDLRGFPRPRGDGPLTRSPAHADRPDWFPRPRGDGPRALLSGSLVRKPTRGWTGVSPPTRGWTPPYVTLSSRTSTGFPRPRGDGPVRPSDQAAGMDPRHQPSRRGGFPRPRGDGPVRTYSFTVPDSVSPPTRGWTRETAFDRGYVTGFPAHAGMDRTGSAAPTARHRFPRPRGDGPVSLSDRSSASVVSPPTRGWTASRALCATPLPGFPAHAGMDPARPRQRNRPPRFPRPRGDGPRPTTQRLQSLEVSPPTRGWTRNGRAIG